MFRIEILRKKIIRIILTERVNKVKKPVVDYRKFRLSKLNTPEFSHLLWLLGWAGYFILYFLTENLIPQSRCFVMHSRVDDLIPFCEFFLIFYAFWYALIVFTLIYFALYNPKGFKRFQIFIISTQAIAMFFYIILPTMQDLRPTEFERQNILTWLMGVIYNFDTPTGVCPSLHVAYSIGIASAFLKEKDVKALNKVILVLIVIMICISTMFVKQHSFYDVIAAIPVAIAAEFIAYGKDYWKPKLKR